MSVLHFYILIAVNLNNCSSMPFKANKTSQRFEPDYCNKSVVTISQAGPVALFSIGKKDMYTIGS